MAYRWLDITFEAVPNSNEVVIAGLEEGYVRCSPEGALWLDTHEGSLWPFEAVFVGTRHHRKRGYVEHIYRIKEVQ